MSATTIHSNGSKWAGQAPDPIETLIERLQTLTLDPKFEAYGAFIGQQNDGTWRLFGNFWDVAAGFIVTTDDAALVAELTALIAANQATEAYRAARAQSVASGHLSAPVAPVKGDQYLLHVDDTAGVRGVRTVTVDAVKRLTDGTYRLTGTRPGPEGGACPLVSWNVDRYGYVLASVGEPMPPVAERRL